MSEKKKLSKLFINSFAFGDFGFQIMVNLELVFFMVFMTDALRFAPERAGYIASFTAFFDVVWVLVAGLIVQKANFKRGKLRTWLLFSPPLIWAFFVLEFWGFSGDSSLTSIIICAGFIISHLIWNCCYTAHIAMISSYTDNVQDRTTLSSRRAIGQSMGRIAFSAFAPGLIAYCGLTAGNPAIGYTFATMLITLPMVICYWFVYVVSKPYEGATENNTQVAKAKKVPLMTNITTSLKNTQLMVLMLSDLGRCFAFYLVTSTTAYYFGVVIGDRSKMALFLTAVNGISVLAAFVAPYVAKAMGKKNTYYFGLIGYGVSLLLVYLFGKTLSVFILFMLLANILQQIAYSMVTAMYADTVVYGEWKTGVNSMGFVMGLFSMPIKFSVLIRSAYMGMILAAIAYTPDNITQQMVDGIRNMMALTPAVVLLVSGAIGFLLYKLTDSRVQELSSEISARQKA